MGDLLARLVLLEELLACDESIELGVLTWHRAIHLCLKLVELAGLGNINILADWGSLLTSWLAEGWVRSGVLLRIDHPWRLVHVVSLEVLVVHV